MGDESGNVTTLLASVSDFFNSIHENSPIRSSVIKTLFNGVDQSFTAKLLNIDRSCVSKVWLGDPKVLCSTVVIL